MVHLSHTPLSLFMIVKSMLLLSSISYDSLAFATSETHVPANRVLLRPGSARESSFSDPLTASQTLSVNTSVGEVFDMEQETATASLVSAPTIGILNEADNDILDSMTIQFTKISRRSPAVLVSEAEESDSSDLILSWLITLVLLSIGGCALASAFRQTSADNAIVKRSPKRILPTTKVAKPLYHFKS